MTGRRFVVAALAAVGVGLVACGARGAGLRGVADGWLFAPADVATLWPSRSPAAEAATGPVGTGVWVAAGQMRLWGMPELPVREVSGGVAWRCRGGILAIGGAWQRTGAGSFLVTRAAVWAVWDGAWGGRVSLARQMLRVGDAAVSAPAQWQVATGPTLRVGRDGFLRLRVSVAGGPPAPRSRAPAPMVRFTVVHDGAAVALAWDRRPGAAPAFGAELGVAAAAVAAFGVRYDGASRSLGPVLNLHVGGLLLRTSHVAHPVLGVTHRFQIVAGAIGAAGSMEIP